VQVRLIGVSAIHLANGLDANGQRLAIDRFVNILVRTAINGLFQQLENPSAYNPADFASQMRKVNSLLR
jgi:hypothetical protein